jgi:hypothetical protein
MKKPTPDSVFKEYDAGLGFNNQINLNEIVEQNENFYIDKQWEGVQTNGNSTPTMNYCKRTVSFSVATILSDNIKMQASPFAIAPDQDEAERVAGIVTDEFEAIFKFNKINGLLRKLARNAAVDGDGCLFTYWDADVETGQLVTGAIRTEVIDNTRVFFGNPNESDPQKQPSIIIERQEMLEDVKWRAKEEGVPEREIDMITTDNDGARNAPSRYTDGRCTVLLRLWRDRETKSIWACECVKNVMIRKPWDLKIRRYPIIWLNWDYIKDCYHGQAMMTGMVDNQKFINKLYALYEKSLSTTAFPKVVFDRTRVPGGKWTNQVGVAIGANGDVNSVATTISGAQMSADVPNFINSTIEYSQAFKGATSVALGDTRPDNTSAIVALQKAAAAPNEITKQNLYDSVEELGQIYLEFMTEYYGERIIGNTMDEMGFSLVDWFDFSTLRERPMLIKLDVGASSYYNETLVQATLDNMLRMNNPEFDIVDYVERLPADRFPQKQAWMEKTQQMRQMMMQSPGEGAPAGAELTPQETPIPTGGGFGKLQREIIGSM